MVSCPVLHTVVSFSQLSSRYCNRLYPRIIFSSSVVSVVEDAAALASGGQKSRTMEEDAINSDDRRSRRCTTPATTPLETTSHRGGVEVVHATTRGIAMTAMMDAIFPIVIICNERHLRTLHVYVGSSTHPSTPHSHRTCRFVLIISAATDDDDDGGDCQAVRLLPSSWHS